MFSEERINVPQVLSRLKEILGIRTDGELAKFFEIKHNTLSTWKNRNTINYERLIIICLQHGITLENLFEETAREITLQAI